VLYQLSYLAVGGDASECDPTGWRRSARNNPGWMAHAKRLFVLRHAKSSWDDPGLEDHERPLAPRGRRAVKVLAEYLARNEIDPPLILCSSSRRTRETLEGLGLGGEVLIEEELYSASPGSVIERLHRVSPELGSVMVIGHNPAMQVLVLRLVAAHAGDELDGSDLSQIQRKFPTGALATLELDCDWSALAPGTARLADFVRPKQLASR
jgi:phosphohistidine phosphatase